MMIRVLVVDDQALIRGGLVALFTAAPDLEVVGEAADGAEAVAMASETAPT
jgi:chemotaxis response regulator CheB